MNTDPYNFYNLEASFENFLLAGNKKITRITIKNYLSDLRHFLGWLALTLRNRQESFHLDSGLAHQYRDYLLSNAIPLKTINRRLSTIRKFWEFSLSRGLISDAQSLNMSNVSPAIDLEQLFRKFRNELETKGSTEAQIEENIQDLRDFLLLEV